MREQAHLFGSHAGLAGVVCQPEESAALPEAPALLFWNVGLNHHVGPNRGWVELARAAAAAGFPSLRFDLSGLGDSQPRSDALSDAERARLDVSQALDFLESRGVARRFLLVANCSGVDSLHAVACRDPRVAGAVYVDGYAWRDWGYRWRRAVLRWLEPARWRRYLWRARVEQRGTRVPGESGGEVWQRDLPSRERFAADLQALVARGARLLFVYSGGMDLHYNHLGQFHSQFGHRGVVDVALLRRADHLYSRGSDRAELVRRVVDWARRQFGPAASA